MPDFDILIEAFEREKLSIQERIASGSCETMEDYRFMVGILEGLTKAMNVVEDYRKAAIQDIAGEEDEK